MMGFVVDAESTKKKISLTGIIAGMNWKRLSHLTEVQTPAIMIASCLSVELETYFIVHTVVNRLKLKPLLVTYNRYYNTPLGIRNLANLRRKFNVDILIQNINPRSVKSIIRTTLRRFGSFHWPAIAGQTVFPVQTAVSHRVPLIIWGAHQGLEQVGMFSHLHNVEMTRRYRKDHDLMGYEADDLLSIFDNLREEDMAI